MIPNPWRAGRVRDRVDACATVWMWRALRLCTAFVYLLIQLCTGSAQVSREV